MQRIFRYVLKFCCFRLNKRNEIQADYSALEKFEEALIDVLGQIIYVSKIFTFSGVDVGDALINVFLRRVHFLYDRGM